MYGQKGYVGSRMSVRAIEAYDDGEMPISKWTKQAILEAVEDLIAQAEENTIMFTFDNLKSLKADELKTLLLTRSSWHHTGSFYNETSFYSIDEDELLELTDEKIKDIINNRISKPKAVKKEKEPNLFITAFVEYDVWTGTRKHPKKITTKEVVFYRSKDKMIKTCYGNKRLSSLRILKSVSQKTKYASEKKVK